MYKPKQIQDINVVCICNTPFWYN